MPKRAPYLVQWSELAQAYELSGSERSALWEITSERPDWFAWLYNISSFAFRSRTGAHFTVRKEHVQGNGPYWYGYRSFHRRTVKRYLGRTTDLSLTRLEEVAEQFADTSPSPGNLPPPSSSLLVSRFQPPRLPLALVERSHLFARLDTWRSHKLTLLWAPAGFGKTTLVNSWQSKRKDQRAVSHVAWVSLDGKDNDPVHFWRSLISACRTWQQEIGETALAHLQQTSVLEPPLAPAPLEMALAHFLDDLTNQANNGILILDNYHIIVEPRVHETLAFFIEHLPTHLHVMILTRNEPPLPLTHWRAHGDIQELALADLRFSPEETATFLQHATASAYSEQTITQMNTLLQGWAAGLRLLVLAGQMTQDGVEHHLSALREQQATDSFRRQLLDYFVSEVLSAQPETLQVFLLQTSELPRLTGPLCDAVTNRQNSGTLLETIERAGLFLEALDEAEPWYRYSSLWVSAMRAEAARRLGEETLRAIARRASLWYEQHALVEEAIETALRANDMERAALLIAHFGSIGQRYELQTLRGWLERIPDAVLHTHPALCLYAALTLQFQQNHEPPQMVKTRVEALLQRAEESWQALGKFTWIGLIFAFRALIASLHEPSPKAAAQYATKALALFSAEDSGVGDNIQSTVLLWRIICLGIVGSEKMHQGCFAEAQELLREALVYSQESSNRQFLGEINLRLGAVCMALGQLHQADEHYRQALATTHSQEEWEDRARALFGLAQLSLEWNDLEALERQIDEALELTRKMGQKGSERVAFFRVQLCAARGQDTAAALQLASLLARLQTTSTQDTQELLPEALALQTRFQLATGDYLAAQRSITMLTNETQALSFAQQMMARILQARLQLAQGETHVAVPLLEQLRQEAQEKRHLRSRLEIQILLALAQAARKQKGEAREWLQQALSQARPEGFRYVFLAFGEPLTHLLRSLLPGIRERALRSYGQMLLQNLTLPGDALSSSPFEPLSPQQQRVLQLLVDGHTNAQIAQELVISVNTVKDHVKQIYSKLGVSNRLQAYEVAHRLEHF